LKTAVAKNGLIKPKNSIDGRKIKKNLQKIAFFAQKGVDKRCEA
jgi:hypothetical protein